MKCFPGDNMVSDKSWASFVARTDLNLAVAVVRRCF